MNIRITTRHLVLGLCAQMLSLSAFGYTTYAR